MMNEELNKELCGLLGIEPKILSVMGGLMWEYPDFTTDSGKVQLLKLMRKRIDWRLFLTFLVHGASWNPENWETSHFNLIDFILDDTGKLEQAALEFLRREK